MPKILYLTYLSSWSVPWAVLAWAPGAGSRESGKAAWVLGWKTGSGRESGALLFFYNPLCTLLCISVSLSLPLDIVSLGPELPPAPPPPPPDFLPRAPHPSLPNSRRFSNQAFPIPWGQQLCAIWRNLTELIHTNVRITDSHVILIALPITILTGFFWAQKNTYLLEFLARVHSKQWEGENKWRSKHCRRERKFVGRLSWH